MYAALWKQPLDSILRDAPANAGEKVLKYIPSSLLAELGLTSVNYREKVLLIREEYNTALDTFEDWNRLEGGGRCRHRPTWHWCVPVFPAFAQ